MADGRLPTDLIRALDDAVLDDAEQIAYLLATTDDNGTPRLAMVGAGELLAVDDQTLRVALWPGTRTAHNLARGTPVLLTAVRPGSVVNVRADPRPLPAPDDSRLSLFELAVTDVAWDTHPGMPVTSGITFTPQGIEREAAVAEWRRQRDVLAAARAADEEAR